MEVNLLPLVNHQRLFVFSKQSIFLSIQTRELMNIRIISLIKGYVTRINGRHACVFILLMLCLEACNIDYSKQTMSDKMDNKIVAKKVLQRVVEKLLWKDNNNWR